MFSPRSSMSARFSVSPSPFHVPPTMYSPESVKKHISNSVAAGFSGAALIGTDTFATAMTQEHHKCSYTQICETERFLYDILV